MTYDLLFWKRKARTRISRGLTFLLLSEGLPCAAVAEFPEAAVSRAIRQAFGPEPRAVPFELDISKDYMAVHLPFSKAAEHAVLLRTIANREGLEVYDPQTEEPTAEDDATFEASCNPPDTGSPTDDFLSWLRAAEHGDPASINNVGDCYRYGSGVEIDLSKAVEWYLRGVQQSYLPAMVNLAECYLNGEGVTRNARESARLYQEVFAGERCVSAFELGRLYEAGLGVEQSLERAAEYYTIARANKHPEAYRALQRLGVVE